MTIKKYRRIAVRFAAMLLCVFMLATATTAELYAAADDYEPIDLTQACTLTVYRIGQGSEYEENAAQAEKIVADVYKIAEAVPVDGMDIFDLKLLAPFNADTVKAAAALQAGSGDIISLDGKLTADHWTAIAQAAAKIVRAANGAIAPVVKDGLTGENTVIPASGNGGLAAGLYLLLVRTDEDNYWKDADDGSGLISTVAYSDRYYYIYTPQLVLLPYKDSKMLPGGDTKTSDEAPWTYDVSVYLKPGTEQRAADLTIQKTLTNYRGTRSASFLFQVEATLTSNGQTKTVYSNVVSIEFSADGTKTATLAQAIPVGARVTITEIYSGPGSHLLGSKTVVGTMTENGLKRDSDGQIGPAEFTNDGGHRDGGSILNHYTYVETTDAQGATVGDWTGPVNTDSTVIVN